MQRKDNPQKGRAIRRHQESRSLAIPNREQERMNDHELERKVAAMTQSEFDALTARTRHPEEDASREDMRAFTKNLFDTAKKD